MENVTKADFVREVKEELDKDNHPNFSQKEIALVLDEVLTNIKKDVSKGKKVQFIGFGSFETHEHKARKGRNPQNGKTLMIPATTVPVFKAGKAFKDIVK